MVDRHILSPADRSHSHPGLLARGPLLLPSEMFGPVPLADPMLPGPGGGLPGGMPGEEPPDFTRMNRAAM